MRFCQCICLFNIIYYLITKLWIPQVNIFLITANDGIFFCERPTTMPPIAFFFSSTIDTRAMCRRFSYSTREISPFLSHCCVVAITCTFLERAFPIFVATETCCIPRMRDTLAEWLRFIDVFQGANYLVRLLHSKLARF